MQNTHIHHQISTTTHNLLSKASAVFFSLFVITSPALADGAKETKFATSVNSFDVSLNKQTKLGLYLHAKDAYNIMKQRKDILFLDVRTRAEINFLGLADGVDANIPVQPLDTNYVLGKKGGYMRKNNPDFAVAVERAINRKGLSANPLIFIICRSGKGSGKAVNILADWGYTNAYTIVDGYQGDKGTTGKRDVNGWIHDGLPWSYGISQTQDYSSLIIRSMLHRVNF